MSISFKEIIYYNRKNGKNFIYEGKYEFLKYAEICDFDIIQQPINAVLSSTLRSNVMIRKNMQLNRKSPEEDRYQKQIQKDNDNIKNL